MGIWNVSQMFINYSQVARRAFSFIFIIVRHEEVIFYIHLFLTAIFGSKSAKSIPYNGYPSIGTHTRTCSR